MKKPIRAMLLGLVLSATAHAAIDTYEFGSDAERERYRGLIEELRCPKCQNQNIADSDAPIAMDLRREIYRMLGEGQSDEQIVDYLVARYGDFVRYKPPLDARTLLLWYGPAGLLAVGFGVLALILVRRRRSVATSASNALSPAERERLATLLDKKDP
ncbi:cytochrome c-type biogenesis protein [Azotobacter chroococcum]|uniref:Cytochrome c-type biogenesis protein n=1 Tax=Azotobacter chroococcum TaxID=353 RepID=A0AAP9YGP6_9GAMM|nr:cytochrome c-type biogenesis protein [Azotobacter chroococcum]QQE90160.1 cytochrome c-type biogenesis protein CcmH [Azotobacter chroococcum]